MLDNILQSSNTSSCAGFLANFMATCAAGLAPFNYADTKEKSREAGRNVSFLKVERDQQSFVLTERYGGRFQDLKAQVQQMADKWCIIGIHEVNALMPLKALALDSDTYLKKDFPKGDDVELSSFASLDQLWKSLKNSGGDILLLHLPLSDSGRRDLVAKLHAFSVPAILILEDRFLDDDVLNDPLIDFVSSPVRPAELKARIRKLRNLWKTQLTHRQVADEAIGGANRVNVSPVDGLRNRKTGRLDAVNVADFFGLSINALARLVNRPPASVHKTPDSESLQESLYSFERLVSAATYIMGSDNARRKFKVWLNIKNKELGMAPITAVKNGKVEMLADWLEDAMLGLPG
jgi:hypothetical protein